MARDIEDFLRRAAERRQQKAGGGAPTPPPKEKPRQPVQRRPIEPRAAEPVEAKIVEPRPVQKRRPVKTSIRSGSVADHVQSHLDTSSIAEHAEQLGDRIANVYEQADTRVHEHLDHNLSKLDDRPTVTGQAAPAIFGANSSNLAGELREVLSNPKTIGRAILIAEILKRPDFDRWE